MKRGAEHVRVIETSNGSRAVWMPNIRNRRYALIAGMCMVPVLVVVVELMVKAPDAVSAVLAIALVILGAIPPLGMARNACFTVTRDFVVSGVPRKSSKRVRRADVTLVRYRGEFGELVGQDGTVLLQTSALLTRQQASEIAAYLHVPFAGGATAAVAASPREAPGAFILRPNRGKAFRYRLIFWLLAAGGIGFGVFDLVNGHRSAAIFTAVLPLALAVASAFWLRDATLVVTNDAVYKGLHNRSKYAALTEIAEIAYGPRTLSLMTANGSELLGVDASFFTAAQAQELADKLGIPLRGA
jgi:hypothetical protein